MTEELNDKYIDGNIPLKGFIYIQWLLDRFVDINYETALGVSYGTGIDAGHYKTQIIDVIRNNPPLASVPRYFHDGRENYLWYSDFYDDVGKEIFRQYGNFVAPAVKITPANYAIELAKIDLPYFKELVNLVSLERLYQEVLRNQPAPENDTVSKNTIEQPEEATIKEVQPELPVEESKPKRSYEPKMNKEQYSLLVECIEKIKLLRSPVKAAQLKKFFNGSLAEPLQVMNQLSLVYLLDEMRKRGYIKKAWMTVAVENKDFISFRTPGMKLRYGAEPHCLNMNQLKSRRTDKKSSYIDGWEDIDEMIEKMQKCRDK